MGISVEVISCRALVFLLRSNARETRRQHSNSIMFAMEPSLLCENNTIEDSFALFSCNRLLVKTRHWCGNWLPDSLCLKFYVSNPGPFECSNEYFGSLKLEFLGEMKCC